MKLMEFLQILDCSGTLDQIFARIGDAFLQELIDELNTKKGSGLLYLANRLNAAALGAQEFSTNLAEQTELLGVCQVCLTMEKMRRAGEIELRLPATIRDKTPAMIRVTAKGKARLEELEKS